MDTELLALVSPSHDESDRVARLRALIEGGADLTARDHNDATLLHHAVRAPYSATDPLPSLDVVRVLLAAGADVHARDRNGATPAGRAVLLNDTMPAAAIDRSVAVLELLVAHGARLDGTVSLMDGGSCAHYSCSAPEIYTFLLEHGAPTALPDDTGNTPLHVTVRAGRPRLVALLMRHGVDTSVVNQLGQTPLGVALHLPEHTDEQRRIRSKIIAALEAAGAPAHVDYPAVAGGPLPIDMAAVRRSAAGHDDPGLRRCVQQDFDSYQQFIDECLSSSTTGMAALLDVCRDTLGNTNTTRTMTGDQKLTQPLCHHGDLVVQGNLTVLSRFVVTGDVTVTGCVRDDGPGSSVVIGGDLRAKGVDTEGEMYVGGTLAADVVHGYYNDFTLRAGVIRGRLVIEDDHAVAADVEADLHFDMVTYEQGYGEGVEDRLRAVLVDDVFSDELLDRHKLFALLSDGQPVFRSDT